MTIIKASCPVCGDVELTVDELRFVLHPVPDKSFYAFTCETCGDRVVKPAGPDVVRLLTLGGVKPERLDIPAEALEEHDGPMVTWDDVLDFSALLESDVDVVAAVNAAAPRPTH